MIAANIMDFEYGSNYFVQSAGLDWGAGARSRQEVQTPSFHWRQGILTARLSRMNLSPLEFLARYIASNR